MKRVHQVTPSDNYYVGDFSKRIKRMCIYINYTTDETSLIDKLYTLQDPITSKHMLNRCSSRYTASLF